MAGRHLRLVWIQCTRPVPPGTRSMDMEENNSSSGWPQRAISLRDIMNHEIALFLFTIIILLTITNRLTIDENSQSSTVESSMILRKSPWNYHQDQLPKYSGFWNDISSSIEHKKLDRSAGFYEFWKKPSKVSLILFVWLHISLSLNV